MSRLKIELGVEDLQKILLDKNGEVPVEIKQSVAQTFANRFLKGVITEGLEKKMAEYISDAQEEIMKNILETGYNYGAVTLTEKFKLRVAQEIDSYIRSQILSQGRDLYNTMLNLAQAKFKEASEKFEKSVNQELLQNLVNKAVNKRFSKLLK